MKSSNVVLGVSVLLVVSLASCKSSEVAYRKAHEKPELVSVTVKTAKADTVPATKKAVVKTPPEVKTETVPVVEQPVEEYAGNLKKYSVVCGSFKNIDYAKRMNERFVTKGYQSQIVKNAILGFYRVVVTTSDDMAESKKSLRELRRTNPDAWMLIKK